MNALLGRRGVVLVFLALVLFLTIVSLFSDIGPAKNFNLPSLDSVPSWSSIKDATLSKAPPPAMQAGGVDMMTAQHAYPQPQVDFKRFKKNKPMNIETSDGNAFATLLCSRDGGLNDPYFATAQSIVWRLLWSWYASRKYPIIVFVCPFVLQEQRDILAGQGAIIHELPLLDGIVNDDLISIRRWVDMFSKLNIWSFTQYKKIAFLDSDAFPIDNLDEVFDLVETRQCDPTKKDDEVDIESFCEYSFAGVAWLDVFAGVWEINGGFFVLSPNEKMHQRLLAHCKRTDEYPFAHMDQSFLNSTLGFGKDSPFPGQDLDIMYNVGMADYWNEEALLKSKVMHAKIWVRKMVENNPFLRNRWAEDWMTQCIFYDSPAFSSARVVGHFLNVDLEQKRIYESREKAILVNQTLARSEADRVWRESLNGADPPVDPSP